MKTKQIKNKDGEVLKTKEGQELKEHTFEAGDEFVPQHNKVYEYKNETSDGKKITNYKIFAQVRNSEGEKYENPEDDNNGFFVSLTPTQAEKLKKVLESGYDINQDIWTCYTYSNEYGQFVGISRKSEMKKPKSFEELDKEE